jgi:hypothetical protein
LGKLFSGLYELGLDPIFPLFEVLILAVRLQDEAAKKYDQHAQHAHQHEH